MQAAAVIGHNRPPSDAEIVAQRLKDQEAVIRASIKLAAPTPAPTEIADEKQAGDATEVMKRMAGVVTEIAAAHKKTKEPFLEASRVIDAWKNSLTAEATALRNSFAGPLQAYLERRAAAERARQLEAAKQERERAEALAAEAQAHAEAGIADTADELLDAAVNSEAMADRISTNAQAAKPAELARARSGYGSTASQRMVWVGEIESFHAIDLNALRAHFNQDDVQKAINAYVRNGGRSLDGVKIYERAQLSVR